MKKKRGQVRKWLTAFILSPGMIFTLAYLLVWVGTNFYLDHAFKRHLKQVFLSETGQRLQLDVRSLETGLTLNSIILKKIELSPLNAPENQRTEPGQMQIAKLEIDWPDMCFLPFSPPDKQHSMREIARQILSHTAQ
ncbi:MAG TPA: hypothetical protein ENL01_03280 [Chlorobaculum parvum]|uniref:Uncharacterized protein n=1 Tax=Chlorobaculum parvum TaxID=274539 RepID=A0A7C5DC47_9CHLB|nr:hypothetical protein [Chlorobaculum parvum]